MGDIPAPPGTLRRRLEYLVVALAIGFAVLILAWIVWILGGVMGLWGDFGA